MSESTTPIATLGGGCFWCLEAAYAEIDGITSIVSGYAGGTAENPTYEQVCSGATGHAEVVRLEWDPAKIGYREILEIFFSIHDPTTLNRQGADVGTQYRSVIFYHDDTQRRIAEEVIARLSSEGYWRDPIVTQLLPAPTFYPAESYHQDYQDREAEEDILRSAPEHRGSGGDGRRRAGPTLPVAAAESDRPGRDRRLTWTDR
jgi:peptide-methionine (S)-S-oxide reductase